jgi:membrane fusion protein (multidrug efflux system)
VRTGAWIGTDWTILDGLKAGDRVIVDNLLRLRPGVAVAPTVVAATGAAGPSPGAAPSPAAPATAGTRAR